MFANPYPNILAAAFDGKNNLYVLLPYCIKRLDYVTKEVTNILGNCSYTTTLFAGADIDSTKKCYENNNTVVDQPSILDQVTVINQPNTPVNVPNSCATTITITLISSDVAIKPTDTIELHYDNGILVKETKLMYNSSLIWSFPNANSNFVVTQVRMNTAILTNNFQLYKFKLNIKIGTTINSDYYFDLILSGLANPTYGSGSGGYTAGANSSLTWKDITGNDYSYTCT
jgi:hypothetical protein